MRDSCDFTWRSANVSGEFVHHEWLKSQCNEGHAASGTTGTNVLFTVKGGDPDR